MVDKLNPPKVNKSKQTVIYHFFNFLHLHWIGQDFPLLFFLTFPSIKETNKPLIKSRDSFCIFSEQLTREKWNR